MAKKKVLERTMVRMLTLIRANLTCGADETFEVLRPTSSALNLLRLLTRTVSSCFLSSKALTFVGFAFVAFNLLMIKFNYFK